VGQEVVVSLNVESREWGGRFYTELSAWRVERVRHDVAAEVNAAAEAVVATPAAEAASEDGVFPF
jgi:hypothetical protein